MSTHSVSHETKNSNRWVSRVEEILKVKNVEELKEELVRLAGDIQKEISKFDIQSHLSPEARRKLKTLESKYEQALRSIQKVQKQFDKEVTKKISVLKQTRTEAESQIKKIRARITKHQGTIVKASETIKKRLQDTAKRATGKTASRKRRTKSAK